MDKEASRISRVVSGLSDRSDIAEILRMAKLEVARAVACREPLRFDRGVAIYEAADAALGDARVRGQLPRYVRAA
jgi:hypothetical protein